MIRVPQQLKELDQWVAYRLEPKPGAAKLTKVPYNPVWGYGASSVKPDTWLPHDVVMSTNTHLYSGPGFMLSITDGFICIDLDCPFVREDGSEITMDSPEEFAAAQRVWESHLQIVAFIDSYTEWSPSGRGLHIWLIGKLPENCGNRIGKIEIYEHSRFITMTGNVFNGHDRPIEERHGAIEILVERLGLANSGTVIEHVSSAETRTDIECVNAAMSGGTAELFNRLWLGDITGYPSGSEADLAFANLICFQTDNTDQAERIFRASPYFQARTKLHDRPDLVTRAVQKGMDKKAPPIDVSSLLTATSAFAAVAAGDAPRIEPADVLYMTKPEGLLGHLAEYLYQVSPRPVREVALAGAIGLLAGITGRAYNISRTGLNQYVVLLGSSGIGKEAISSGISRLMQYIIDTHPSAEHFIGPSHIASAPALYGEFGDGKNHGKSPSFMSIIGEFGKWLAVHTDPRAQGHYEMLIRAFLDLWAKSGRGNTVGKQIYANKDKTQGALVAPAFSFIGESVPGRFYSACTADAIEGGLVPRLLIIEYKGDRPALNKNAFDVRPSHELVYMLKAVCERALQLNHTSDPIDVQLTPDAEAFLDEFNTFCDFQINQSPHEVVKAIWNRSHLKALKLAGLIAVGKNWLTPVVELHHAQWAKALVVADAHKMLSRFDLGEIQSGSIDNDRQRSVLRHFKNFIGKAELPASYKIPEKAHKLGIMPLRLLTALTSRNAAFRQLGRTHQQVLEQTLKELMTQGIVETVDATSQPHLLAEAGLKAGKAVHYVVTDHTIFDTL